MDSCSISVRNSASSFDCIMFDLDDTLYSSEIGLGEATKRNIEEFLVQKCGFSEMKASSLRVELFRTYGSTLAGLRALGYNIDADDYHSFVHGRLPYDLIKPDAELRSLLRSINHRKIIFTNSDWNHAIRALDKLGIRDCFEQVICFETMNPNLCNSTRLDEFPIVLKPSLDAIKIAIEVGRIHPRRTLFLDDSVRNIVAGKSMGLQTILVGKSGKIKEADHVINSVKELGQVAPEIWAVVGGVDDEDDVEDERIRLKRIDSAVLAPPTIVGA